MSALCSAAAPGPVPAAMRDARRWVAWRHVGGHKPPVGADGQPLARWNDADSWLTYDEARAVEAADGVGFVLGDGWSGLDLDDCRGEDGELDPRAQAVLELCAGAYAEVSPSGKGLKVFGRGGPWLELNFRDSAAVTVATKPTGYFCVTGRALPGHDQVADLDLARVASLLAPDKKPDVKKRDSALPADGGVVHPGRQDQFLTARAGHYAVQGRTVDEILDLLRVDIKHRCPLDGRDWSDAELRRKGETAVAKFGRAATRDPFLWTDPGCAEFFAAHYADAVSYDLDLGRWLVFDGARWAPGPKRVEILLVESLRRRQAIALSSDSDSDSDKRAKRVATLIKREDRVPTILARSEAYLGTRTTEWDRDPFLLGVPNGVVDLRTGALRSGAPEDRVTMQAAFSFDPAAKCELWEATVGQIFAKDPSLVEYTQRALGYSITGDCREEVFFLCTSALDAVEPGREGKGTLVNTVFAVLGDYAENLGFSSLEAKKESGGASPDLAKLVHKRFVTASEASGARFNEARIKGMTGRDNVTTRFLYGQEFTYRPEFKLWLSVNHLPKVRDDAFWSRPHRIPFRTSFRGKEDKTLKDRLLEEGPGILAWLVRGCLAWQAEGGLKPPPSVTEAVKEYRQSQSPLAEFYEARCVFRASCFASIEELRAAYVKWCEKEQVHFRLGPKNFSQELAKRFTPHQETSGRRQRGYLGVGLACEQADLPGLCEDDNAPL